MIGSTVETWLTDQIWGRIDSFIVPRDWPIMPKSLVPAGLIVIVVSKLAESLNIFVDMLELTIEAER